MTDGVSSAVDRRIVIVVVLVAAAALSWWWSQNGEMPRMGVVPTGGNESDYSFKGLAVSEMGPGGDLVHTLAAAELEFRSDDPDDDDDDHKKKKKRHKDKK